jgi:hypothetical protein
MLAMSNKVHIWYSLRPNNNIIINIIIIIIIIWSKGTLLSSFHVILQMVETGVQLAIQRHRNTSAFNVNKYLEKRK